MTDPRLTRRETLQGIAALGLLGGFGLGGAGNLTRLANGQSGQLSVSPSDGIKRYSDTRVAVHVPFEDRESLDGWIEDRDGRELKSVDERRDSATVLVPQRDIATTLYQTPRLDQSWIGGEVDVEQEVTYPDPPEFDTEAVLPTGALEGVFMNILGSQAGTPDDGVAFGKEDTPEGSIRDARQVTGASDTVVSNTDTSTTTIAVIDTGVNTASGDVFGSEARILNGSKNMITGETVGQAGLSAVEDGDGHGTHVASTIAADPSDAEYRGYAPDANLLILKALGDDGGGSTDGIARAITYAADNGADLINASLGSPFWSAELVRAMEYAAGADTITVVAAGNDRQGTRWVNHPSDAEPAITVAAGTVEPPANAKTAYFSNIGPDPGTTNFSDGQSLDAQPDVAAPGMQLTALVADTSGGTETKTLSGTSMACPCVTGIAALVLAGSSVEQAPGPLRDRLTSTAVRCPNMGIYECGGGYPDAQAAVDDDITEPDQADERTDAAQTRDTAFESLSNVYGNQFARFLL